MLFYLLFSFLGLLFCFFLPGLVSLSFLLFPRRLCQVAFSGFLLKRWCSGITPAQMLIYKHHLYWDEMQGTLAHSWQHFYPSVDDTCGQG
jgi:hypothetical protein